MKCMTCNERTYVVNVIKMAGGPAASTQVQVVRGGRLQRRGVVKSNGQRGRTCLY
jgi:hypothetical protein